MTTREHERFRIVGLEEHFVTPDILEAGRSLAPADCDLAFTPASQGDTGRLLLDLGVERLDVMDQTGIDVQVLSVTTPGLQNLESRLAVRLQSATNDLLAETVRGNPTRFQGLATLATGDPERATAELQRCVSDLHLDGAMLFGRTGDQNLDDPRFWQLFDAAEALHVPLHLHPQSPPPAVRRAYYDGFNGGISDAFATHGVGWHYDSGIQFLRIVLAGVFDRFPDLQIVLGHWGELILFYLERIEHLASMRGLEKSLGEYVRSNLYVTPSGMLSERYLRWATEIVGPDRILFATDYPFEKASASGARAFLERVEMTATDRDLFASGNWERLRAGIRR